MREGLTFKRNFNDVVLPYLAQCIRLAHRLNPAKWGVTPYYPHGVRLNVGFCESLTASSDEITVIVDDETARKIPSFDRLHLPLEGKKGGDFYPSVPGSRRVVLPNSTKAKSFLELLQPAHHRLIEKAVKTPFNAGSRTGHQDWTVDAIAEAIGSELPLPDYDITERRTFLLTWNPALSVWDDFIGDRRAAREGRPRESEWTSGVTKSIQRQDRVYLMRLGPRKPNGLVASGTVTRGSLEKAHWEPAQRQVGKTALFLKARFEVILDVEQHPEEILSLEIIKDHFPGFNWTPAAGGTQIPPPIASQLASIWGQHLSAKQFVPEKLPEEIEATEPFWEGAVRRITVNAFERDPRARARCIDLHGTNCAVCDFNFGEVYGARGEGFIHVHHVKPLAEIRQGYVPDPSNDLKPVCPNCHAMLHASKPQPCSVDELRKLVQQRRQI